MQFLCQNCGFRSAKWLGRCPDCGQWNSFLEQAPEPYSASARSLPAQRLTEISGEDTERHTTGLLELDRVLGGGLVPGSLVLIGGAPGIGKSTLMLQVAANLPSGDGPILYVTGEESLGQMRIRGDRIGVDSQALYVLAETSLERILSAVGDLQPQAIVIDSIQTIYSEHAGSPPGTISVVREAAARFLSLSKTENIPVFLIGHITKDGSLAGPKALEHIVDTVIYFEGDENHRHRILRTVKNRFGPALELGIFRMTEAGLKEVGSPSHLFLDERVEGASGSAVSACLRGSRPLLIEIQALVSKAPFGNARRIFQGLDRTRLFHLLAVLEKRLGINLLPQDVFVNVVGGVSLDEPAVDLGIAAAILSSLQDQPIDSDLVIFGEIGLAGEVRAVPQSTERLREAAALGFRRVLLPQGNKKEDGIGLELLGVQTIGDTFDRLF